MIGHGIITKKMGMTRVIDSLDNFIPVTVLRFEYQKIVKKLCIEKNGYNAVQIGFCVKKDKKLNKPDIYRLKKSNVSDNFAMFKEFRINDNLDGFSVGSEIKIDQIKDLRLVDITGISIGKGFQGAIKRWNKKLGPSSHGSRYHRGLGSIGQRTTPGRVYKNKKMPGHGGAKIVTIQNMEIIHIDEVLSTISVKGAVPGANDSYVVIRPAIKAK